MTLAAILEQKRREVEIIERIINGEAYYTTVFIEFINDHYAVINKDENGTVILDETTSALEADRIARIVEKAISHQIDPGNVVNIR